MSEPASPAINTRRERQSSASSRPLSQISGNNLPFTPPNRESSWSGKPNSRPSSVANDSTDGRAAKRASITLKSEDETKPVQTISLNLNDYASASAKQSLGTISSQPPKLDIPVLSAPIRTSSLASPRSEVGGGVRDIGLEDGSAEGSQPKERSEASQDQHQANDGESVLRNARDSLRPAGRTSYAEVARASPTSPVTSPSARSYTGRPFDTVPPTSSESYSSQPQAKAKPSWLRRTTELPSMSMLRSKSKSPLTDNVALPPTLPPRHTRSESTSRDMLPPSLPSKSSYADVTAGPSRDSFIDNTASTGMPPRIPPRNKIGDRIAAFSRSASSASLASQASSSTLSHQRLPSSAQRVLGNAGSAVQKGWAGIRARGVGGSLSSISQLGQSSRRGPIDSATPRLPRERHKTAQPVLSSLPEGPDFADAVLMRDGKGRPGTVFGRPLVEAGQEAHVMDANAGDEMERRRRHCLPSIVVRCVEYLEIWGPKEEGIFRISGRSSHIARLKKEFDLGADLDMRQCHPGDLDPHAVAGLFKSYLRELPTPILTSELTPMFDAYAKRVHGSAPPSILNLADLDKVEEHQPDELDELLAQLPDANWFLLADLVKLLDLIPRHVDTNRMTLHALMVSLGPSLKVGNGVLSELLEHRIQLFSKPPARAGDTVTELIDFGTTSIDPPSLGPITTVPLKDEQPLLPSKLTPSPEAKKGPKLSTKPSLTKLFSSSSRNLPQSSGPQSPATPLVDAEPPRVDLTLGQTSPLPTFGTIPSPPPVNSTPPASVETTAASTTGDDKQIPAEVHYPAGTVQERTRALSSATPIADLFSRKSPPPPLRGNRDSIGSSIHTSTSLNSLARQTPDRPTTVIRRGHSAFFGSGSSTGTNGDRRHSLRSIPNTPNDKDERASTPSSVREMIKDMERRDA